jgi:signal transduction histidine kinase
MSANVLYFAGAGDASDGLDSRLSEQGFQVLRSGDAEQLLRFARLGGIVGTILEAGVAGVPPDALCALVRQLRESAETAATPIIALLGGIEDIEGLDALAEAGVSGVHVRGMPEAFLLGALKAGRRLAEMEGIRAAKGDIRALADETRQAIHDLSQPLAALQGRLQVIGAKTPQGDPIREPVELMVKLVLEVSAKLRELQELQRKHGG